MTTKTTTKTTTRAALAAQLAEAGVTGEAAELVLAATAGLRHAARCDAARVAATETGAPVTAVILDAVGVGGRLGLGGDATARAPWARGLGTGRKHARDGGAWSAAIEAARGGARHAHVAACDGVVTVTVTVTVADAPDEVRVETVTPDDPDGPLGRSHAAWWRACAGLALAELAGGCDPRPDLAWVTFAGDAREWARVFNDAALELEVASHAILLRAAFAGDGAALEALERVEAKRIAEALARLAPDEREAFASAMAATVGAIA
jgi:hypothetical protein